MQRDSRPSNLNRDSPGVPHILTFPFPLASKPDGGLPTVILNEAHALDVNVAILTTDDRTVTAVELARILPADKPPLTPELSKLWFGTGYWPLLHPQAHTSGAITREALNAMYPKHLVDAVFDKADRSGELLVGEVGSHAFLHRFVEEFAPSRDASESFNAAFARTFKRELARSLRYNCGVFANIQDYFFAPLAREMAPLIREHNVTVGHDGLVTLHLHTTIPMIPDELPIPPMIEELLRAASTVDVVLTHTPVYNDRLERMMKRLDLKVPELRTFALGIDEDDLRKREGVITPGNYQTAVPGFESLTSRQQTLVHGCFEAEKKAVPHQFGLFDRMDPGKGVDTVFEAIDAFLTEESRSLSLEELRGRYRFFNLMSQFPDPTNVDPTNLKETYAAHVLKLGIKLEERWPGIFMMAEGLSGKQRDLLVALMRGRTVITGGAEDGLNQVVMESSFLNRDLPTAVIAGNNIGFVMEMKRIGIDHNIYTFGPGRVLELRDRLRQVVSHQRENRDHLVAQKAELNKAIELRNASMLVSS